MKKPPLRKSAAAPKRRRRWAVDFDGTVSHLDGWKGQLVLGEPIQAMVDRIKKLLAAGDEVYVYTARLNDDPLLCDAGNDVTASAIQAWCKIHIGESLPVFQKKMFEKLFDDNAVQVVKNTGFTLKEAVMRILDEKLQAAIDGGDIRQAEAWEDAIGRVDKLSEF